MTVAAVVFDLDGLMVDTEPLYKQAWQQAAAGLGYDLTDEHYARFVGLPAAACERILIEAHGGQFPLDAFRRRWPALWFRDVAAFGVQPKPGLLELLDFIAGHRLPTAVATSSEAEYATPSLLAAGLAGRFDVVVTGDQVSRGKPAPDIYLEAARRLGVEPTTCVALEDSEPGIQAVAAAGMTGVLVPHWPASPDARAAAFCVVDSLHHARIILAALLG